MNEGARLYAGTQHGLFIWRSTNNNDWEQVGRTFSDGIVDAIFGCKQTPERVFVGVMDQRPDHGIQIIRQTVGDSLP